MTKKDIQILKALLLTDTPKKYRQELWIICSGAKLAKLNNKSYYKNITEISSQIPSWSFSIQIEKDLNRSKYKNDIKFINKTRKILNNFSIRSPTIGYCQGFNFIVEFILTIVENEVSNKYIHNINYFRKMLFGFLQN